MNFIILFLVLLSFNIVISIYICRKFKEFSNDIKSNVKDNSKNNRININILCYLLITLNVISMIAIIYLLYSKKLTVKYL